MRMSSQRETSNKFFTRDKKSTEKERFAPLGFIRQVRRLHNLESESESEICITLVRS